MRYLFECDAKHFISCFLDYFQKFFSLKSKIPWNHSELPRWVYKVILVCCIVVHIERVYHLWNAWLCRITEFSLRMTSSIFPEGCASIMAANTVYFFPFLILRTHFKDSDHKRAKAFVLSQLFDFFFSKYFLLSKTWLVHFM